VSAAPLERERLLARFRAAQAQPAILVCAPEGFGKTIAVRQFVRGLHTPVLRLDLLAEHGSLVSFARALAQALEPVAPGLRSSYAHAVESALQSPRAEDELAIWFLRHLDRSCQCTVLIDDLHHAVRDLRIFKLIELLLRETPKGYRWVIASRELPPAALRWSDTALCAPPIDRSDLELTFAEASEVASAYNLSDHLTSALYDVTGGWPLTFTLAGSLPQWIPRLHQLHPGSAEGVYGFLAEQWFLQCDRPLQKLLVNTCVLPTIDHELIAASSWRDAWPAARQLAEDGRLLSIRHDHSLQLRDLFRAFLEQRLSQFGTSNISDACTHAAELLERCGRIVPALQLYARGRDDAAVLRLCEQFGFSLVDEGRLEDLQQALGTVQAEAAAENAVSLAVRAIAESNAERSDVAEAWYLHAMAKAQSPEIRAEVAYRYGLDLVRHGRKDVVDLLEPYVGEALPVELDASIRSTLATAYVIGERFQDAREMMKSALALLGENSSRQMDAKLNHHAAWVSLFTGEIATAKIYAQRAVTVALECGMYDVAARAYSVLLNISGDVDDDPKTTLELFDRILDCALRAGSASVRLYALIGSIDVLAEMGDAAGVERIERVLASYSIDYGERHTNESLLAAEALLSAARGRFAKAYHLIFPTGERQITADRRALRFSEIAFYAAAGGLLAEAKAALNEVNTQLQQCDPKARRTMRTQINHALSLRMLGDRGEAKRILDALAQDAESMSPRLRSLHVSADAIFRYWDGEDNYDEVYDALAELREKDFGGIAGALAALPGSEERIAHV
jgi:tetratricopeptide (TPR) repeat protein